MKHRKWIRSIYLLRNDELSREEQRALDVHLNSCESCRAVYENIQMDWVSVMGEMSAQPELSNPDLMTHNILSKIETITAAVVQEKTTGFSLWDFMFQPRTRVTLQLATLALLAVFLVEQIQVTSSLRDLEMQLHSESYKASHARVSFLPKALKSRVIVSLKGRLEKRGLPVGKLEQFSGALEIDASQLEFQDFNKQRTRLSEKWFHGRSNPWFFKGQKQIRRQP